MRTRWLLAGTGMALIAGVVVTDLIFYREARGELIRSVEQQTGGRVVRGPEAIRRLGCGTCHTIPGVTGASGDVGPPLDRMASRVYIAGVMPNTADNLIVWIRWPQGVLPKSGMPNTGASAAESRDIAAYLLTLK